MLTREFEFDKDLDLITCIDTKSHEEYWTKEEFKKRLSQKSITCLVMEEEGSLIAFLIYEIFLRRFTIIRMGVHRLYRRKGIGKSLILNLINKLNEKRELISAEVRETNLPVQLFLKAQQFKAVEVLQDYYPDTRESAFVFHYRH